jgi:EAL domain-containing protein (putative c-di-GMP-specific phosphodiesterase class I)
VSLPKDDVVVLARRLATQGLPLVAEKVETREVFDWTREAGCSLFQGYDFWRPQPHSGGAVITHASHLRLLSALTTRV